VNLDPSEPLAIASRQLQIIAQAARRKIESRYPMNSSVRGPRRLIRISTEEPGEFRPSPADQVYFCVHRDQSPDRGLVGAADRPGHRTSSPIEGGLASIDGSGKWVRLLSFDRSLTFDNREKSMTMNYSTVGFSTAPIPGEAAIQIRGGKAIVQKTFNGRKPNPRACHPVRNDRLFRRPATNIGASQT
jgi:hypothetical protein